MFVKVLSLYLLGVINIIVGAFVLGRDYKKLPNVAFFGLSASVTAWVFGIAMFYRAEGDSASLLWAQFYYAAPVVLVYFLVIFARSFPNDSRISFKRMAQLSVAPAVLLALLIVTPSFFFDGIRYQPWGKEILLDKIGYLLYSIYIIVYFSIGLGLIYLKKLSEKGLYKKQAALFLFGGMTSAALGLLFNLILPWLGNYQLIWVGPLTTSIFVGSAAVSIVRHKMFDVRVVVARTLGYSVSLFVLALLYGFIVFGITGLMTDQQFPLSVQITLSAATAAVSLFFPFIKQFFDRQTNRLFYRDAYDPQAFLAEINRIVVANVDVEALLDKVCQIVEKHIKTQFIVFELRETAYVSRRVISTSDKHYTQEKIEIIEKAAGAVKQRVIVADTLESGHAELMSIMQELDVAITVRLAPSVKYNVDGFGLLLLGPKRSGNPYSKQDINVIRILAGELAIAIQNALRYEEIEKFNITLQEKVDDATKKLRNTNDKLKAMDETKDEFISMASHQLRTPLTSVKGYLSMVLEGDAGELNAMQKKLLDQAFISSQRMVYLIADLLNVSRLRTGKFVIEAHPANLAEVIKGEVEQLIETAEARNLKLTYDKPKDFPVLNIDETKLRQVIMNFMDNAIYYTPSGGHIDIRLKETDESIEFTVNDDGMGVPKTEQHHLFNKFYRAGNARKARPDGTGLGLFMAKKVIMAQGGSVVFRSQEGKGSTFGFSFAKAKLALPRVLSSETPPEQIVAPK